MSKVWPQDCCVQCDLFNSSWVPSTDGTASRETSRKKRCSPLNRYVMSFSWRQTGKREACSCRTASRHVPRQICLTLVTRVSNCYIRSLKRVYRHRTQMIIDCSESDWEDEFGEDEIRKNEIRKRDDIKMNACSSVLSVLFARASKSISNYETLSPWWFITTKSRRLQEAVPISVLIRQTLLG